ncbi:MAG: phospholipase D-like domain-containing protein [Cyclobacteriaceae bacterium]|nr:phospholipase D-like domain-containing protein [Cyclobacteriaceae bacterium]MDH4296269.1 phospholipase D-like domain-containing protein [Cyclobacteriaceae bacterium]MDH5251487.1 phospholipase D-like domain-containing protein [Cyclobacteriaceae bacterium]
MDQIIAHLRQSIADEVFSKEERKTLRTLLTDRALREDQLTSLRTKIFELASEKVNDSNFRFIIEWVKNVNSALVASTADKSDAFFSPGDACRDTIIKQINGAITRIKICVFTISDDRISHAIMTSHRKGLDIKVITDNDKSFDMGSDVGRLAQAGIAVKMDSTPNHMHHKFMVVDDRALITGSYNWTQSAARYNHENILLTKEGRLVDSYLKEFDQLWKEMQWYN